MLMDGPYIAGQRTLTLRFRGSANQRIIDVPASLAKGRTILHPLN
jgi:anaerobic ribonucleoside-triphosphate reductase activating protein